MPQEDASFCLVMGWQSRNTGCRPGDHGSQLHRLQMELIVKCPGLILLAIQLKNLELYLVDRCHCLLIHAN